MSRQRLWRCIQVSGKPEHHLKRAKRYFGPVESDVRQMSYSPRFVPGVIRFQYANAQADQRPSTSERDKSAGPSEPHLRAESGDL